MLLEHTAAEAPEPQARTLCYAQVEVEINQFLNLARNSSSLVKVKREHLDTLIAESFEAKRELAQLLKLGPDYRLRFQVPAYDALQDNHLINSFVSFLRLGVPGLLPNQAEDSLYQAVITNTICLDGKRQLKFTRHLARVVTSEQKQAWADHARNAGLGSVSWDQSVASIFQQVAACRADVVLSANPLDFLLSSEQTTGWDSCYAFDGCHANGGVALARDNFTLLMFLDKSGAYPFEKQARSWVYVPKQFTGWDRFVVGFAYGSVADAQVVAMSNVISSRLAESQVLENKWKAKTGAKQLNESDHELFYPGRLLTNCGGRAVGGNHEDYSVYFDASVARVVVLKASLEGKIIEHLPKLAFENARCLACGVTTSHNESFACDSCAPGFHCDCCSERCSGNSYETSSDDTICSSCYENRYFTCTSCDNIEDNDEYNSVGNGICNNCLEENYTCCKICDEYFDDDDETGVSNVCSDCVNSHYTCCDDCGTYEKNDDVSEIAGDDICSSCVSRNFTECAVCDEPARTQNLQDKCCEDCHAQREEESSDEAA